MYNFNFFGLNFPKNGFRFWNSESKCRNLNQNLRDTMCANFWAKQTTLTFLAKICPKKDLGLEIQITNVEIRISILEIPCVRIFRQNEQLWLFWPKLAQKWIFGSEFQKSKSGFGISTSRYHVCQFLVKMELRTLSFLV